MKILNKVSVMAVSAVALTLSLVGSNAVQAATAPSLGTAGSFAVLAGSGISNTGATTITGDVGTFPTTTQTGFGSITLNGTNNAGNAVTQGAKDDLVTAYNNAAGQSTTTTIAADLGGQTLTPGVYTSASSIGLTGTLTLDAQGSSSAVFIFQAGSTLTTASASSVVLTNGASACNVFWQIGSSATLGTTSTFRGNILAFSSITDDGGSTITGRLLARNAAVTLNNTVVNNSACVTSTPTTPTTPTTTSASEDIRVIKTASKTNLQSGPEKVTFTYRVSNTGDTALTDVSLDDNKCDDVDRFSGDNNDNDIMETNEAWNYHCTKTVKQTETNIATAKGHANGREVRATDKVTVTVSTPGLPNAGVEPETNLWNTLAQKLLTLFSLSK